MSKENKSIKEWKSILETVHDEKDPILMECEEDERKGVQQLLKQWKTHHKKLTDLKKQYTSMNSFERLLWEDGHQLIAGVDEVGRGPLAGPVVAAAVILNKNETILGLNDSKKLSEKKREELYKEIKQKAISIGVGIISAKEIDEKNILQATKTAMKQAIDELDPKPDALLLDAVELNLSIAQQSLIKGDSKSNSIAAASIVAKVTRDRLMKKLSILYPMYGFENHMGYGTKEHVEAVKKFGITEEHRLSFAPIKEMI